MKKKHQFIKIFDLSVSKILYEFVNKDLLPKSGVSKQRFWKGFNQVVHKLSPINKKLIETREKIQKSFFNTLHFLLM